MSDEDSQQPSDHGGDIKSDSDERGSGRSDHESEEHMPHQRERDERDGWEESDSEETTKLAKQSEEVALMQILAQINEESNQESDVDGIPDTGSGLEREMVGNGHSLTEHEEDERSGGVSDGETAAEGVTTTTFLQEDREPEYGECVCSQVCGYSCT